PDPSKFPCLELAYRAGRAGGVMPAAMNAADEVAVAAFLDGKIGFMDIPAVIEQVMEAVGTDTQSAVASGAASTAIPSIEAVLAADLAAREAAHDIVARCTPPVAR
ncbi:MAG TPA: hypothetical protein VF720_08440, partial [Candidatus Eisenbacteria bacterium]